MDRHRTLVKSRIKTIKVKLVIAYDGENYAGWQVQVTGVGVQQRIEEALAKLFPSHPRVHSSSRTDTGVHALGMVAHLEVPQTECAMSGSKLALALNAHLPDDIRILGARRCRSDFHARFHATGKQYRYFVWNHRAHNPLLRRTAWLVPHKLNLTAMRAASRLFLGQHDFAAFAGTRSYQMESTVRTLTRCDIQRRGPLLTFVIEGDGFLYRMCRCVVGTLIQVGRGRFAPLEVMSMMASKDRRAAGMTAPAHGLVLWKVFYGRRPAGPPQGSRRARVGEGRTGAKLEPDV